MKTKRIPNSVRLSSVVNVTAIVSIHYFEFDKNFHFSGERHNYWEMVYVDSGNVYVTANGKEHVLGQGEIIFHKPDEFHTISADKQTPSNVFVITFVTSSGKMKWFENRKTVLPRDLRQYIKIIISEGEKTFDLPFNDPHMMRLKFAENPPTGGLQLIKTALEQLLIMMIRYEEENLRKRKIVDEENSGNKIVSEVVRLLSENIYGKITVKEICEILNYSKTYISKVFKKVTNMSPREYLRSVTI